MAASVMGGHREEPPRSEEPPNCVESSYPLISNRHEGDNVAQKSYAIEGEASRKGSVVTLHHQGDDHCTMGVWPHEPPWPVPSHARIQADNP